MLRGLPYSLVVHLIMLAVVIVYGAHVPPPPLKAQHMIRVRLSEAPRKQQAAGQAAVVPPEPQEAPEQTAEPTPEPVPEPKPPEPEPQTMPKKKPEQKVVPAQPDKPDPKPQKQPAASQESTFAQAEESSPPDPTTGASGTGEPMLSGTDEPFPFAWYLDIVKGRITRNWNPPQIGIRDGSERSCAVHFIIESSGAVTRETLVSSSGIPLLDREGLRAVRSAHPLPPLPRGFASRSLGITFVFHLRSGL